MDDMDLFYSIIGSVFGILGLIIVISAIKGCRDLLQAEKEMKASEQNKVSSLPLVVENDSKLPKFNSDNEDPI